VTRTADRFDYLYPDSELQEWVPQAARLAESRQMSVRQLEDHIRRLVSPAASRRKKKSGPSSDTRSLQNRLQRRLGARVRIVEKGGRGRIEIEYSSLDDLDRLLELLEGRP
jgi:ParB family chromosome partitioning protein